MTEIETPPEQAEVPSGLFLGFEPETRKVVIGVNTERAKEAFKLDYQGVTALQNELQLLKHKTRQMDDSFFTTIDHVPVVREYTVKADPHRCHAVIDMILTDGQFVQLLITDNVSPALKKTLEEIEEHFDLVKTSQSPEIGRAHV